MAFVMRIWGTDIIGAFIGTSSKKIIDIAHNYLLISTIFYFFLGQIFIYRNALQGMGISSVPLISSIIELVFRGLSAFVLAGMWGFFGICCASPICWVAACLFTAGSYFYVQHTMRKIRR